MCRRPLFSRSTTLAPTGTRLLRPRKPSQQADAAGQRERQQAFKLLAMTADEPPTHTECRGLEPRTCREEGRLCSVADARWSTCSLRARFVACILPMKPTLRTPMDLAGGRRGEGENAKSCFAGLPPNCGGAPPLVLRELDSFDDMREPLLAVWVGFVKVQDSKA